MLPLLFALLLCLPHWVAGDDAGRIPRHHNSAATSHVLSQLLVLRPKFMLRDNGDGCPNGWHVCLNFPNQCAPDGSFCCSATGNCPDNTNCFGTDQCCPQDAQTCGGQTCCDPGSICCSGNNDCCASGHFCCGDSLGGCCANGTSCTPGSNTCSGIGSSGGGGSNPSPLPPPPPPTVSLVASTFDLSTLGTSLPTTIGGFSVTPTFSTPSSSSSTTSSSSPTLGGISGSSRSISMTSIAKTAGLAVVVSIIALGGPVL